MSLHKIVLFCLVNNKSFSCIQQNLILQINSIGDEENYNCNQQLDHKHLRLILKGRLEQLDCSHAQNCQGSGIRTIPVFGDLINNCNSFYQNGVLTQQFIYYKIYIIGVYYLNNHLNGNLMEPILMQGSFHTTESNYAMIFNSYYQNGTAIYFLNQYIQNYPIGTWNVTCIANTRYNFMNIDIFCQNEFSNGIYNIIFYLPPEFHYDFGPSAFMLFTIIMILLIYFFLKFIQKTQNVGSIYSEVEL
ncbi:unnamed protein product (macronuclear) [Paramecium tetraurelia]|uniref:Transmembrane protein n=1 Tax=Paramecium tetraurelia TaxID=5888 RepID=A0EAA6_PARTE|nr:uncharacterized protein GSPATT00024955001 [Paramecium tetraurelia]CAK92223.1 unnamed protein product [Paramecium tetraurelia]|eukprot:XP_001459620.1 hypothetical protein (macronuclear) [Paramecium tetraurelia strain d4-2]